MKEGARPVRRPAPGARLPGPAFSPRAAHSRACRRNWFRVAGVQVGGEPEGSLR